MSTVGLDVAERAHEACFLAAGGREAGPPLRFADTRAGVARPLERGRRLPAPVTAALGATGPSRLALHDAPGGAGLPVRVLDPLQTHAYRRTTVRRAKPDRRDARASADVVRLGRARGAYVPDGAILQPRELTRFRWGLVDRLGDAKRQALTIPDRVFPEYPGLFGDPFVRGARALWREATSAAESAAGVGELAAVLRRASPGHLGAGRAAAVQAAARDSLGVTRLGPAARFALQALLDQIELLEAQLAAAEREIGAAPAGAAPSTST